MKCPGCGWEIGKDSICENCLYDFNASEIEEKPAKAPKKVKGK